MIKFYIFLITFISFASNAYSTNVIVIDINYLINNSKHFIEISEKINNAQQEYKSKFINIEQNLYKKKEELENLELILNEDEFNIKKNLYYNEVANFENEVHWFDNREADLFSFVEYFIPGKYRTIWVKKEKVCTWSPTGQNFDGGKPTRYIEGHRSDDKVEL